MSEPQQNANGAGVGILLGAGALVWSDAGASDSSTRLAIVHRPAPRNDWVLPKGHIDDGESVEAAALREAAEETGANIVSAAFAGTYHYVAKGVSRLILIWHARRSVGEFPHTAPRTEIDQVEWVSTSEAIQRLSYESEREFVRRHSMPPTDAKSAASKKITQTRSVEQARRDRLDAHIATATERLRTAVDVHKASAGSPALWWIASAQRSLDAAAEAAQRVELDRAWSLVHDAERVLVFALSDEQLIAKAVAVHAELSTNLRGWRKEATTALFSGAKLSELRRAPRKLDADHRATLQYAVVESLAVFNEDTDNYHHRVGLISGRMQGMVWICGGLVALSIIGALVARSLSPSAADAFPPSLIFTVILSGALGGTLSTLFQLSRLGPSKVPDALLRGLMIYGRPLIGAVSALFIVAVYRSGIVTFIENKPDESTGLFVAAVLGFLAGLSEKFVMGTAAKVTAPKDATAKSDDD